MIATTLAAVLWLGSVQLPQLIPQDPASARHSTTPQACDPRGPPLVRRLMQGGVYYCGRITGEGTQEVIRLLAPDDTRLVISSVGGEREAPLELARIVTARRLDVEAAGPCFSGCASAVFIAARRRIVGPGGIIAFHNTNSSAYLLAVRLFDGDRGDQSRLAARAADELRLYVQRGVDPTLLIRPQIEVGTLCVARTAFLAGPGERVYNLQSTIDLWAPDRRTLREHGVPVAGDYPSSQAEIERRLRTHGSDGYAIRFGPGRIPAERLYPRLFQIGPC